MNEKKKSKYMGALGAILVHIAIIVLLLFCVIRTPERLEESGVTVMMGDATEAYGGFDPSSLVDVEVQPETSEANNVPEPESVPEQEMITQIEEETIVIDPPKKTETKPNTPPVQTPRPQPKPETTKPDNSAAERAAEEARMLAEQKAEQERKAAAEAANNLVAGAFGKGNQMGNKGTTTGTGAVGIPTGNSSTGAATGSTGYGSFDLGGRSLGEGGLPRPQYTVQEEGKVVVTITVNPSGQVIATSINRATNTVNATLRKAAEDAAKKARFNTVEGLNNQTGTITYYFNLK